MARMEVQKPWYAQQFPERRRAHARLEFDLIKRVVGGLGRLQSISPRAIARSSFSSALVQCQPGRDVIAGIAAVVCCEPVVEGLALDRAGFFYAITSRSRDDAGHKYYLRLDPPELQIAA